MKHFLYIIIIAIITSGCHSSKTMSQSAASVRDSTSVSETQASSSYDAAMSNSLRLMLDSLDVWIYNYPLKGERVSQTDSTSYRETSPRKDLDILKAIHITAKEATLDNTRTTEIHSKNDTLSKSLVTSHSDTSENTNSQSSTTVIAKPPNVTWILIVGIAGVLAILAQIIYYKNS